MEEERLHCQGGGAAGVCASDADDGRVRVRADKGEPLGRRGQEEEHGVTLIKDGCPQREAQREEAWRVDEADDDGGALGRSEEERVRVERVRGDVLVQVRAHGEEVQQRALA